MTVAVYPGTFDPVTYGHLDVINRGAMLFDLLIVGVAENPPKGPTFTMEERIEMLKANTSRLPGVEVKGFTTTTVAFVHSCDSRVILRGIRTVSDFESEFQMALTNRVLNPEIETIFVMPSEKYSFIRASIIKGIIIAGGDASDFVPEDVQEKLRQKLLLEGA